MPCSDGGYYSQPDHSSEINDLQKQIKQLIKNQEESKPEKIKTLEAKLIEANDKLTEVDKVNKELKKKLDYTTELLCEATFILHNKNLLKGYLGNWFETHTEVDAIRMNEELQKLIKKGQLKPILNWIKKLNEKEKWVFENHKLFENLKFTNP